MKLTRLVLVFTLLGATTAPRAFGGADEPIGDDNAALQYWQAAALINETAKKHIEDIDKVKLDGEDVPTFVLADSAPMQFLHAGAAMPRCDWGLDFRKGPETLMPHLHMSRDLARVAVLRARYRFAQGRHKDGVDDLLATFELAKDVGETPVLISLLVRYNIEQFATDALARHLPTMDRATLDQLAKALEAMPAEDSLRRVWAQESKYFVDWGLERMDKIEKESGGDAGKWAQGVLALALWDADDAAEIRRIGVPPPAKFRELMLSIKAMLAELGKATDLPPAEQDARLVELQKPFQSDPVAKILVPQQNKIFLTRRRWQARHAMLDAAVAVVRDGEAAIKEKRYADPFGDGPFTYRKTDTGFELHSKLMFEGKPVTLTVGKAK